MKVCIGKSKSEKSIHTPKLNITQDEDRSETTAGAIVTAVVQSCQTVLNLKKSLRECHMHLECHSETLLNSFIVCLSPGSDGHMCQQQLWAGCT